MSLKGLEFDESWKHRLESKYGDVPTQFISAPDLIVNKRFAGRYQDLADVENLKLSQERKEREKKTRKL